MYSFVATSEAFIGVPTPVILLLFKTSIAPVLESNFNDTAFTEDIVEPFRLISSTFRLPSVPKEVKDDPVTVPPNVVSVSTVLVLILIPLPVAKSIHSELVQASVPFDQANVLSPSADFNVNPPPSAPASSVVTPILEMLSSIFLSSTLKFTVSTDVVVPLTVRFPSIFVLPPTCKVAVGLALYIPTALALVSILKALTSAGVLTLISTSWFES